MRRLAQERADAAELEKVFLAFRQMAYSSTRLHPLFGGDLIDL
jgi:hypothetical protein